MNTAFPEYPLKDCVRTDISVAKACGMNPEEHFNAASGPYCATQERHAFYPSCNIADAFYAAEKFFDDEKRWWMICRRFDDNSKVWQWSLFEGRDKAMQTGRSGWHATPALAICAAIIQLDVAKRNLQ